MVECPQCHCKVIQQISGSILRCSACGHQEDSRAKKRPADHTPAAPYVQPGADETSGKHSPAMIADCPYCSLRARRIGSAKFEFICDSGHQFTFNAFGNKTTALLDTEDIGPIAMGGT